MEFKLKIKDYIWTTLFFLICFTISTSIFLSGKIKQIHSDKDHYHYIAANKSSIIEGNLDTILARVYTLSAIVYENNGDTAFFDKTASRIYNEVVADTGISLRNIGIAPNGIVSNVYPLEGNEALIGFDFTDESKPGNVEAIEAIKENNLVITNPFELSQGGYGMAGKLPIYLTNSDGQKEFWGLVTVTINFDELMNSIKMDSLAGNNINYCLWYEDTNGEKVILSESEYKVKDPISYNVNSNNLVWHLDVSPNKGWYNIHSFIFGIIVIATISALISFLILSHIRIHKTNLALKNIANRDNLTGCYSRHFVTSTLLDNSTGDWLSSDMKYSIVIIDVDYFKAINDNFGHSIGDHALISVGNALKGLCRVGYEDFVVRYGGDEFIMFFNNISLERLEERLGLIKYTIENISLREERRLRITVSMGAKCYSNEVHSYSELFSSADSNLYAAKEAGRKQFILS